MHTIRENTSILRFIVNSYMLTNLIKMIFQVRAFYPLVPVTVRYCKPALRPRRYRRGERGDGRGTLHIIKEERHI